MEGSISFQLGDLLTAGDLSDNNFLTLVAAIMKGSIVHDDEFHVDTPSKTPSKQKKKYGWMEEKKSQTVWEEDENYAWPKTPLKEVPKKSTGALEKKPRAIDAVFVAPLIQQAMFWARMMNYDTRNVILANMQNVIARLKGIEPDEDLIVHLCGPWLSEFATPEERARLRLVKKFLDDHGFEVEEVPEIGKTDSTA